MKNSLLETAVVLIVDDDPTNLGVLFNELQRFNCTILLAQDGKSAIELAINEQPQIILLDILMPGLNGFETCLILKKTKETADIPVLFLSALHDVIDQVRGFEVGGVDYITKPFKTDEVIARIITHLTLWKLRESLKEQNDQLLDEIKHRNDIQAQLLHSSTHDSLTGLLNRDSLLKALDEALAQRAFGHRFAILFLDLDRFKIINDSLGHLTGDIVLRMAAERIQQSVREQDVVTRFGGDEFVIILNGIQGEAEVVDIAAKICHVLNQSFEIEARKLFSGASVGIVFSNSTYQAAQELLRDADVAMYQAKAKGGLNYQLFSQKMHEQAIARLQLESDIRQGVLEEQFTIYYQPIVSAKTGRVHGFEALMRWRHPKYGVVLPGEFLSIIEETSLIVPLGQFFIKKSLQQLKIWHQAGFEHLFMSVNMSTRQLNDVHLISWLTQLLEETHIASSAIEIEITEGIVTRRSEIDVLQQLVKMGFRISIDDFGIGSSLECLKHFPLNTLKIDQSFVRGMMSDEEDMIIVRAMIALANRLKLKVIVEGVETEEQYYFLQRLECDEIQGFYFSEPVPENEATHFLMQNMKQQE